MKTSTELPPIYAECVDRFGVDFNDTVFTYGDTCHSKRPMPEHLIIHESVHSRQQGNDPEGWWRRYLDDGKFRLDQEIEAYRAQYLFYTQTIRDRNACARFLHSIALDLSGPMYGRIIGYREASNLISR